MSHAACDAAAAVSPTVGTSYSPAAVKQSVVPYQSVNGGFSCTSAAILTLLGNNYLKATVASGSNLTLTNTANSDTIKYSLAADSAGANPLTPGTGTFYINGVLLNLLGLLGNNAIDVPVYVKPNNTTLVSAGTYKGSVNIKWDWSFCSAIGVGNLCIGTTDAGSKTTTVNLTVYVAANPPVVTVSSSATTWDPLSGATFPKAIPGSKRRMTVTVTNPDYATLDASVLNISVPTPNGLAIALDGDGATANSAIKFTDGSTASNVTLSFLSGSSMTDNVDFSSNSGSTWVAYPIAGDAATQNPVTTTRLRPQGSMAPNSSFSVSISYSVK